MPGLIWLHILQIPPGLASGHREGGGAAVASAKRVVINTGGGCTYRLTKFRNSFGNPAALRRCGQTHCLGREPPPRGSDGDRQTKSELGMSGWRLRLLCFWFRRFCCSQSTWRMDEESAFSHGLSRAHFVSWNCSWWTLSRTICPLVLFTFQPCTFQFATS